MPETGEQHWDPDRYIENARYVSELGMPVVDLLSPKPGERILDLGCGDGDLTLRLQAVGCDVVAVDASLEMVERACSLGLDARRMDGERLQFNDEFDAVFSNAALHWMKHPEAVIDGVWRALKPGRRFAGEFGGYGNVSAIVTAMESALSLRGLETDGPWYFPRPESYRDLLESRGFFVHHMEHFPRPTPLPGDVGGWLETFAMPYTSRLPPSERGDFIVELTNALRGELTDDEGRWFADYVRLRFCATKATDSS